MKKRHSPPRQILDFLGSVKMTIVLLIFGAIAMCVGTILESRLGVDLAKSSVYSALWFDLFLLLIAVNLAAAVVNRIPLKRHQLSFVVVHASIILLMLGAWISRHYGYEGQLRVYEGQGSSDLHLYDKEILFTGINSDPTSNGRAVLGRFALPDTVFMDGLVLQKKGEGSIGVVVKSYVADGFLDTGIAASEAGNGPGISYTVSGQGESVDGWLLAGHPEYGRNDLGPFEIETLWYRTQAALDFRIAEKNEGSAVYVERSDGGEPLRVPMPEGVGQEFSLEGDITVTVASFYEFARVMDGGLANDPSGSRNPAAVVDVTSGGRTERHMVFSEFPEFSQHKVDAEGPLTAGVRLTANSAASKPMLTFIIGPEGKFYTQANSGSGRGEVTKLLTGQKAAITGTPYSFALNQFFSDATKQTYVTKAKPGEEGGRAILQLAVETETGTHEMWLEQGASMQVVGASPGMVFDFTSKSRTLPFRVDLDDFQVDYYPGGRRPANYSSDIRIASIDGSTPPIASVVSMNRPLDYMGFRLFQSSYALGSGGRPDMTILSVSYDPGVPVVYAAFAFLIFGVGWYTLGDGRKRGSKKKSKPSLKQADSATNSVIGETEERPAGQTLRKETVR